MTRAVEGLCGYAFEEQGVFEGEILYFMEKGTMKISARATVKSVQNFVKLTDEQINL